MKLGARRPGSELPDFPLNIARVEALSTARGFLATTVVTLHLTVSPPPEVGDWNTEGTITFTPPPGWEVTGAALDIAGEMRPASLAPAAQAAAAYHDVVSRNIDPCLIQLQPDGQVRVNVFPIRRSQPRRLRLEFSGLLHPVADGLVADFPLRFQQTVPEALLSRDFVPGQAPVTLPLQNFRGGGEAAFRQPLPSPPSPIPDKGSSHSSWIAQPDEQGGRWFQGLLPAAPLPAPRRILLLADTSQLQESADRAEERRLLEDLLRRAGQGQVSLIAFSTEAEKAQRYEVENGTCPALLNTLDTLPRSGAPRPGAVDASAESADLILILSSLADPLGSGAWPRLPAGVPVVIVDTVSPQPLDTARQLAETSGGALLRRGAEGIPVCPAPLDLKADFPPGTIALPLLGQNLRLVLGPMPDKIEKLPASGPRPEILPGSDAAEGRLLRGLAGRRSLREWLLSQPNFQWSRPPARVWDFPLLSPDISLIVLEQPADYARHGIAPPPGLSLPLENPDYSARSASGEADALRAALDRPPGSPGDDGLWRSHLSGWKEQRSDARQRRMDQFRRFGRADGSLGLSPKLRNILEQFGIDGDSITAAETAGTILPRLALEYPGADWTAATRLLRQARKLQSDRLRFFMNLYLVTESMFKSGPFFSSAPSIFKDGPLEDSLPRDFLSKGSAGGSPSDYADPFAGSEGDSGGDPFAASAPATATATATESVPQNRGDAPAKAAGPPDGKAIAREILIQARGLHQAGDLRGAVRTLSGLILAKPDHGSFRLLAWQLLEWRRADLALEALRRARQLFGDNDTTLRDLALAWSEAGNPEAAQVLLPRVSHGLARRELLGLRQSPQPPQGWRMVLECADPEADADLEIVGPEEERVFWDHPLPSFGGALSFDGTGFTPEDFLLPQIPPAPGLAAPFPLTVSVRLHSAAPAPVRLTLFRHGTNPARRTFLLPQCPPGLTQVTEISPEP